MAKSDKFNEWLTEEMNRRNWSMEELARQAGEGASRPLISLVLAGERSVTWNFCAAIAGAFKYDPVDVFKIAGLLPPEEARNGSNGH